MRWLLALGPLVVACDETLVTSRDGFGPFFLVSGRFDAMLLDGVDDPAKLRGGLAWLVVSDESVGVTWQPAQLEARLLGYAMRVDGPPDLSEVHDLDVAPSALRWTDTRVALGLPVLHVGEAPLLDREAFLLWSLGTLPDASRIFARGTTVRAAATGYLLGVVATSDHAPTLGDTSELPLGLPWCRWASLEPGLVLYRDVGPACEGWRSLAYALEFQGIDMVTMPTP